MFFYYLHGQMLEVPASLGIIMEKLCGHTVKAHYYGNRWGQKNCPDYRVSLLRAVPTNTEVFLCGL